MDCKLLLIELETGDVHCSTCGVLLRSRSEGRPDGKGVWISVGRNIAPTGWHYEAPYPKKNDPRIIDAAFCAVCAPADESKSGMMASSWRWV